MNSTEYIQVDLILREVQQAFQQLRVKDTAEKRLELLQKIDKFRLRVLGASNEYTCKGPTDNSLNYII
jgi:hypothetical protein